MLAHVNGFDAAVQPLGKELRSMLRFVATKPSSVVNVEVTAAGEPLVVLTLDGETVATTLSFAVAA
jgi:hypothetical protein